jgi:hypothetical protein
LFENNTVKTKKGRQQKKPENIGFIYQKTRKYRGRLHFRTCL